MSTIYSELSQLLVYRNLLEDELVKNLCSRDQSTDGQLEPGIVYQFIEQAEQIGLAGNVIENYLLFLIGYGKNVFSSTAEKNNGHVGSSLFQAAVHDVALLKRLLQSAFKQQYQHSILSNYQPTFHKDGTLHKLRDYFFDLTHVYTAEHVVSMLCEHYGQHGLGDIASCVAFKWNSHKGLVGLKHCDQVQLDDIIGYERQKKVLISNTEAFLAGRPANNILLVGARGTGKSSSVKAVVNKFFTRGLRLVEVTKHDLLELPRIMQELRQWGKKFILFLDDLSFEEFEVEYKQLKSVMDGGAETKPDNVLIYATSNRRHLIREGWNERGGEELHRQDTINEKISLSDRFGITLTFLPPNQDEYLKIVEEIAKRNNLHIVPAELRSQALQWEMAHSGRSGRVAQQFVAHLAGKVYAS